MTKITCELNSEMYKTSFLLFFLNVAILIIPRMLIEHKN